MTLITQPSAAPTRKITAVALGGAVATIVLAVVGIWADAPAMLAAAITTVCTFAAGYLVKDRA